MKNIAPFSAAFILASTVALAYDSDPGYAPKGYKPSGARNMTPTASIYVKPTMRYYGKGYTVAYRFVGADSALTRSALTGVAAPQNQLPASATQLVAGVSPRVTYYNHSPRLQSPVVTPATRAVGDTKELPAIAERVGK